MATNQEDTDKQMASRQGRGKGAEVTSAARAHLDGIHSYICKRHIHCGLLTNWGNEPRLGNIRTL